jgi:hypothetical protein
MTQSRYTFSPRILGNTIVNSQASTKIIAAIQSGRLSCSVVEVADGTRLDHIAHDAYGDSSYWWVIAAASGIGWGLQVPPGTVARIPTSIDAVIGVLSDVQ